MDQINGFRYYFNTIQQHEQQVKAKESGSEHHVENSKKNHCAKNIVNKTLQITESLCQNYLF
jgi:hypothetical protein